MRVKKTPNENHSDEKRSDVKAPTPGTEAPGTKAPGTEKVSTDKASTVQASTGPNAGAEHTDTTSKAVVRKRWGWPRLTVIVVFALVYAYDLFEAISDTLGVSAQIAKYNENATLIGINTVAVPWAVLVANLLLPIVVFFLALLVARKRNFGILALVLLAGLGVVAALSLSLTVLAGVLTR